MIKIIPAINADTFEEIKEKIALIEKTADKTGIKWVQVDVADGTFTKNTLWHNPKDLLDLQTSLEVEYHLMINEPEKRIDEWLAGGTARGNGNKELGRIIFHLSASKNPDLIINRCRDYTKWVGIAISPDESLVKAVSYKDRVDMFQILTVHPGLAGQAMVGDPYAKVKELRKACPKHPIEIDGGVNIDTAKQFVDSGATMLVAASAIFKGDAIEENVEKLRLAVNKELEILG